LKNLDQRAVTLEDRPRPDTAASFNRLYNAFANSFNILEETDMPPTAAVLSAVKTSQVALKELQAKWMNIKTNEIPKLNATLKKAGLSVIQL
jgi:catalase (peroxidase I)